ncbi:MAG: nucleotide exchange factor GrpE [Eubacteriales bacterium]|nr:nucleotide exchange factor GrpE [Eubacteriales bacterium]
MAEETKREDLEEAVEETAEDITEEVEEKDIEEPAEENQEEVAEEKKGLFGKKKKKDKKDEQIEELTDRLKRQMAEFDNFRKRTEKEKEARFEIGAKSVIEKMLPIVDNFERGLATVSEEQREDPFVEGMEKVYKQLMASFEAMDVMQIEAVGKEFDPNLHNAVLHVEDESYGENIVAEELLKGYTYKGNVVRYSMVKVAN